MTPHTPSFLRLLALSLSVIAAGGAAAPASGQPAGPLRFPGSGTTVHGDWHADVVVSESAWQPGAALSIEVALRVPETYLASLAAAGIKADQMCVLVTAERTFDADGWMRLPSDERMSTLLTPTGLAIEGGVQGAVTTRYGYPFRTALDEFQSVSTAALQAEPPGASRVTFIINRELPGDLPPGLYRLRFDFGVKVGTRVYNLNGFTFAGRPFSNEAGTACYFYSPIVPASGAHVSGRQVDATQIQARCPWLLLSGYNSNGYRGVVADEDRHRFATSDRSIIPDEVILPLYDGAGNRIAYSLEPRFPVDTIDPISNLPWDWTNGEWTVQVTAPSGLVTDLGTARFVAKSTSNGPTTRFAGFTSWKPPTYGRYTVTATGWIADASGRRYQGGGTYRFWIAKRMTLATATFQGQPYPVGSRYGRDIQFNPALPADVEVTATLYVDSDPANSRSLSYAGAASPAGVFGAAQGMMAFPLDAPGEYHAQVLATFTDAGGHLWVSTMRHAGIVYPATSAVVARGKKFPLGGKYVERGHTNFEGYIEPDGTQHLAHITFPYLAGDMLLIGSEGQGANKIEPVLTYQMQGDTSPWDTKLNGVGTTNLRIRTSNGYSPHLYPEYITDIEYYYAAAPRPGFMGRFLVGESNVRAPYWPVSPNSFGGQIGASPNGDAPGDIYRLLGGVVLRRVAQSPMYSGYIASAFLLPKGTNDNRVIAAGSEDLIGATGETARFFLTGLRPGMAFEVGGTFRPAVQIDPLLPVAIHFVLTYPDGSQQIADGVGDTFGSFAGPTAWPLDVCGVYRYQVTATWSGFEGRMPGLPETGGEFYVYSKDRPAGTVGVRLDLPNQSTFSPAAGLTIAGSTRAASVRYAIITPGAVVEQGDLPVSGGRFQYVFDPRAVNAKVPIYDIVSITTGQPQIGRVIHLTFFAAEQAPEGTPYFDVSRVILRGTTAVSTRNVVPFLTTSVNGSGTIRMDPAPVRSCGTDCSQFSQNQVVTLTPLPAAPAPPGSSWAFAGWSGDTDCLDGKVTMNRDVPCSATFVPSVAGPRPAGIVDVNNDGRGDAFRYNPSTGAWSIDFSDGTGRFNVATGSWSPGWQVYPAPFRSAGDLFVYNSKTGQWFKCLSDGTGGFVYVGGSWSPGWQVATGDFNGDGMTDVFVYNNTTGLWYTCLTTGADASGFNYVGGRWDPAWRIHPADLDGNGRTDLFVYNDTTGRWYWCLSNGAGDFSYRPGVWTTRGWQISAGDFNADGRADLFLYNPWNGRWFVCLNNGSGFDYQAGTWSSKWTARAGDFNGDGRTDIFVYNQTSGTWYQCLYNGGGFDCAGGTWSSGWQVSVTDLNGDRLSDVLVYNATTGAYYQCLNAGGGSFTYTAGTWGKGWTVVASR